MFPFWFNKVQLIKNGVYCGKLSVNTSLLKMFFSFVEKIFYWLSINDLVSHARYQCNYFSSNPKSFVTIGFLFYRISSILLTFFFCCLCRLIVELNLLSFKKLGFSSHVCVTFKTNWKRSGGRFVACLKRK